MNKMTVNQTPPDSVQITESFQRFVDKANELISLVSEIRDKYNITDGKIGDLSLLSTNDKTSLVSALNELHASVNDFLQHVNDLGDTNLLPYSGTIVENVLSLYGDVGFPLSNLGDGSANSLIEWLNNLNGVIGSLGNLTTSDTSSLVNAINSLVATIGDLGTLTTNNRGSVIEAINEINGKVGQASETVPGSIEIATQAETDAGVDDSRAITPKKLVSIPFDSPAGKAISKLSSLGAFPVGSGDILPNVDKVDEGSAFIQKVSGGYALYVQSGGQWIQLTDVSTKQTYVVFGSPPSSLGNEEDFAIRYDFPYGLYYKRNGQWVEARFVNFYEPIDFKGVNELIRQNNFRFIHTTYEPGSSGSNTFVGAGAGSLTIGQGFDPNKPWQGSNNTNIGVNSNREGTTSFSNTSVGAHSLRYNISGNNNIAIGDYALYATTNSSLNVAVGPKSLYYLTNGYSNVSVGYGSGLDITSGGYNTFIGTDAGRGVITGINNTFIGQGINLGNVSNNIALATGDGNIRARFDGNEWVLYGSINGGETYNYLKALDTSKKYVRITGKTIPGDNLGGIFEWVPGDQRNNVSSDVDERVWVASNSDPSGATGAWKRLTLDEDYKYPTIGPRNLITGQGIGTYGNQVYVPEMFITGTTSGIETIAAQSFTTIVFTINDSGPNGRTSEPIADGWWYVWAAIDPNRAFSDPQRLSFWLSRQWTVTGVRPYIPSNYVYLRLIPTALKYSIATNQFYPFITEGFGDYAYKMWTNFQNNSEFMFYEIPSTNTSQTHYIDASDWIPETGRVLGVLMEIKITSVANNGNILIAQNDPGGFWPIKQYYGNGTDQTIDYVYKRIVTNSGESFGIYIGNSFPQGVSIKFYATGWAPLGE